MPAYLAALVLMFRSQLRILAHFPGLAIGFYCGYIVFAGLFVTMLALRPACVVADEELEAYLSERRSDVQKLRCKTCHITRPLRAFHCRFCNRQNMRMLIKRCRCILKWQEHSFWYDPAII